MNKSTGMAWLLGVAMWGLSSVHGALAGENAKADFTGTWGCILFRVGGSAGSGVCPAGWHALKIGADGNYKMGSSRGRVTVAGRNATFAGALAFMGAAEMTQASQFEFQWRDAEGYSYWAVFIKTAEP